MNYTGIANSLSLYFFYQQWGRMHSGFGVEGTAHPDKYMSDDYPIEFPYKYFTILAIARNDDGYTSRTSMVTIIYPTNNKTFTVRLSDLSYNGPGWIAVGY